MSREDAHYKARQDNRQHCSRCGHVMTHPTNIAPYLCPTCQRIVNKDEKAKGLYDTRMYYGITGTGI